ncbi:MAG TPA: HepT-like ribonuclease domain-containing protein [Candidatus Binatia bacterium]|nr:HepT-like ribonuclease domain-containing protein [Candidatus Binatia bacterium]
MRNILVHDYFRINHEIVWETVEHHLPPLKAEVQRILAGLPAE